MPRCVTGRKCIPLLVDRYIEGMNSKPPIRPGLTPAVVRRLDEDCSDDLSSSTTAEERIEMVAVLSRRMWELTGRAIPTYARHEMPVRIVRRA